MSDHHEYEVTVIIRDKEVGGIYGDSQSEEHTRTIVRDVSFDWDDTIDSATNKIKNVIDNSEFSSC